MSLPTSSRNHFYSQRGIASIEFVTIVPVVFLLLYGAVDLLRYLRFESRIHHTASALVPIVADLDKAYESENTSSHKSFDDAIEKNMPDIYKAAQIMFGDDSGQLGLRVAWEQRAFNYRASFKQGADCQPKHRLSSRVRTLLQDPANNNEHTNRGLIEFVQIDLCYDLSGNFTLYHLILGDASTLYSNAIGISRVPTKQVF